jgi:glycosyltransferase involved in cell wall biosynthesis
MTHYYNLVLSRLNQVRGIDLTLLVPENESRNIGEGVYQTSKGASFKVRKLPEVLRFGLYQSFRGLSILLMQEKPQVIIATDAYCFMFLLDIHIFFILKLFGIKLILKSIPFMLSEYPIEKLKIRRIDRYFKSLSNRSNRLLRKLRVAKLICRIELFCKKLIYSMADAHVCYTDDAYAIYGSYGVSRNKIFISRNSPDTDMLFSVRRSIELLPPLLPQCDYRLIHVGRLVPWKKVDLLIRAFAQIKWRFSEAELLIIGDGPELQPLKELAQGLKLNESIEFLGGIYDSALLGRYLMSSTLYILAGMGGLSINEAMCFGLPVLCSVCDGTEKMLVRDGYNGLYFIENDEKDLVNKIIYLFDNPSLRKEMGVHSTMIIRDEVNINTVISGYKQAIQFAVA